MYTVYVLVELHSNAVVLMQALAVVVVHLFVLLMILARWLPRAVK
jgi:hypothetical protein